MGSILIGIILNDVFLLVISNDQLTVNGGTKAGFSFIPLRNTARERVASTQPL